MKLLTLCLFIYSAHYVYSSPFALQQPTYDVDIPEAFSDETDFPVTNENTYLDAKYQDSAFQIAGSSLPQFKGNTVTFGEVEPKPETPENRESSPDTVPKQQSPAPPIEKVSIPKDQAILSAPPKGNKCTVYDNGTNKVYKGTCNTTPSNECYWGGLSLASDDCKDIGTPQEGLTKIFCCVPRMHCALEPYLNGWCTDGTIENCSSAGGAIVSSMSVLSQDCPGSFNGGFPCCHGSTAFDAQGFPRNQ